MIFEALVNQILNEQDNLGRAYRQTKKYLDTTDSKYPVSPRDAYNFYKTAQSRANRIVTKQGQVPVTHVIFLDRLKDNRSLADIVNKLTSKGEDEISVSVLKSWDDWERGFSKTASSVAGRNVPTSKPRIVLKGVASNVQEWYPTDAYTTSDPKEKIVSYPSIKDLNKTQRSGYDEAVVRLKDVKWNSFEVVEPDQKYYSGVDKWNNQQAFDKIKQEIAMGTKQLTSKGLKDVTPGLASRVSIGSDEVRNIAQTGKVTSRGPYKGHTFFYDNPDPKAKYLTGLYDTHGQGPLRPGQKMGYVLRGDKSKMTTPEKGFIGGSEGYYQRKGYMTLPPGSEAGDIKSLQRIKYPQSHWEQPTLGKERDFNRFMQIYNKLSDAFKRGKIQVPPPRITPGAGAAGIASLMQFLNTEVPPDMKNSLLGSGGLGIKGKFEATP